MSEPRDLNGSGTSEERWRAWTPLHDVARWVPRPPPSGRAVVVAPHPDDEILGAGGTLALLTAAGADVVYVAVTDGEASHPGRQEQLRRVRPCESARAAARLGILPSNTHRLGHPDGRVDEPTLLTELSRVVNAGDLVLAPWASDGHPDHDRTGRASLTAARRLGAAVLAYLVWTWHWATPGEDVPWGATCRVDLGPEIQNRKRDATRCFATQITGPSPILSVAALERLTRPFEVFIRS